MISKNVTKRNESAMEKTEFMSIRRICEEHNVRLGSEKLNQVGEYTYLVIKLDLQNAQ